LATALITGAWHPWGSRAPVTHTEIRLFTSGEVLGLPAGLRVRAHVTGTCNDRSNVLGAPEAHRCGAGKFIYDPCLGYAPDLTCVDSPWARNVVSLHATAISYLLPHNKIITWKTNSARNPPRVTQPSLASVLKTPPWAVELANGERCVFVDGATFAISGERANYECSHTTGFNDGNGAWVIGKPDRSHEPWFVSFLDSRGSATHQVAVRVAWF
jgi:hypothetical protein